MSFFRRKKVEEQKVNLSDKVIDVLNYTPADYVHTPGYEVTYEQALEEARKEISKLTSLDEYIDNYRDPIIDSDENREIEYGKKQYTHHVSTILHITEQAIDAGIKATSIYEQVENAIVEVEAEMKRLDSLGI